MSTDNHAAKKRPSAKEINRKNRAFWKATSKKFTEQIEKRPDLAVFAAEEIADRTRLGGIKSAASVEYLVERYSRQSAIAPAKVAKKLGRPEGRQGKDTEGRIRLAGAMKKLDWTTYAMAPKLYTVHLNHGRSRADAESATRLFLKRNAIPIRKVADALTKTKARRIVAADMPNSPKRP